MGIESNLPAYVKFPYKEILIMQLYLSIPGNGKVTTSCDNPFYCWYYFDVLKIVALKSDYL